MGLRSLGKRLRTTVDELDDERKRDRLAGLDLTPIEAISPRVQVRIGGEVTRSRIAARSGVPAFEITVSDGTGSAVAVFTGRRSLAGLDHQRVVVLEGVPREEHGQMVFLNPAYELQPH